MERIAHSLRSQKRDPLVNRTPLGCTAHRRASGSPRTPRGPVARGQCRAPSWLVCINHSSAASPSGGSSPAAYFRTWRRRSELLFLRYFSHRIDRDFQSATATWRLRLLIGPRRPYLFPRRRRWRRLVIWRWRWFQRVQRRWRGFWWWRRRIELVANAHERISQQTGSRPDS